MKKMEINEIVNLVMNSGMAIVVVAYFIVRDWRFQSTLEQTLSTLVNTVNGLKEIVVSKGEK